jgi:cyclophilin family peptidyl-prolyl cis-trans isomerase
MSLVTWINEFFGEVKSTQNMVEPLEDRRLMAVNPVINDALADNRGQVILSFDHAMDKSTLTGSSVRVFTAGDDKKFGTDDDKRERIKLSVGSKRLTITARNIEADTRYRVWLRANLIKDADGNVLDGEFNGEDETSGNGTAGGNYEFEARVASTSIARFTTDLGPIHVELLEEDAPITVANFLSYANKGDWDNSIFHRSLDNFVIQGGGFDLDSDGFVGNVRQGSQIKNEPGVSNKRGTLAMAKVSGQPNSATNQWFFNAADNSGGQAQLDTQNGGFTVFGRITNSAGRAVMDAINDLNTVDAGGAFSDIPVMNEDVTLGINVDAAKDLVILKRVAVLMRLRAV